MTQGQDSGRTAASSFQLHTYPKDLNTFYDFTLPLPILHGVVLLCTTSTTTLDKWKKHLPSQSFEACVFVTEVVPDYK